MEIKQTDPVDEFTDPSSAKKMKAGQHWDVNGLLDTDLALENPISSLLREDLVNSAMKKAREGRFLVISSPPGTGKSSLLQLVKRKLARENTGSTVGFSLRPSEAKKKGFDLSDYVKKNTGVCYRTKTLGETLKGYSEVWILIDDAQRLYHDDHTEFWEDTVKGKAEGAFGASTRVIVVVAATYYLSNVEDSPVAFENEQRIKLGGMLLSKSEAEDLFKRRCMRPDWSNYFERLFYITKGAAAAFTLGLNLALDLSEEVDMRNGSAVFDENAALEELLEGKAYLSGLKRCFPVKGIDADGYVAIVDAVVDAYKVNLGVGGISSDDDNDHKAVIKLKKAGILTDSNVFTSPIAARFYYQKVFPRPDRSSTNIPTTLDELITSATQRLSARRLRCARQENSKGGYNSPKEAVYQQLFHEAIAALLPMSYLVIPELGTSAEVGGKKLTGELDFYIKNGNKWALELLRDGSKRKEHMDRIPGKYKNVEATRWLVVDCRLCSTPTTDRLENLCTLVFSGDFKTCECYMRLEAPVTLSLSE